MNIILNPTESMIDIDLEQAMGVMMFHNVKTEKEFRDLLNDLFNWKKNKLVYIHYYSKNNTYTVGYKRIE